MIVSLKEVMACVSERRRKSIEARAETLIAEETLRSYIEAMGGISRW